MQTATRREVLGGLGRGMLFLGLGPVVASRAGFAVTRLGMEGELTFGELEPLVGLMQETPADKLLPILIAKLANGTELDTLMAAGALANARTFGGQDYNGYHAFMAMLPALEMSARLPKKEAPLPVFKVLYRSSAFIEDSGGRRHEALDVIAAEEIPARASGANVRAALRGKDIDLAEASFASVARGTPQQAYDELQTVIHEDIDVHRIVLAWRVWDMLKLVGDQHAHTMMRQSVRHCVDVEERRLKRGHAEPSLRRLLPELVAELGLENGAPGSRLPDDDYLVELADFIFASGRDAAAGAMATALAEGFAPDALGECLSLAGNKLLLNDPGRSRGERGKPAGSVHGASVGVHASDAARAWRSVARVVNPTNRALSLIVGAYHTAGQSHRVGKHAFPYREKLDDLQEKDPERLLRELEHAVEAGDQKCAVAAVERFEDCGGDPELVIETLLPYSIDADGALHAEKYFSTVCEDFAESRPAFRWHHLKGLARVNASQYGFPAPGLEQARELLGA